MRRLIAFLLALLLALTPAIAEETAPSFEDEVTRYLDARFRGRSIIGGAVIISKDGETLFEYAFGHHSSSRRTEVSPDTCFRIASVTKLVSAVGLMQLVEQQGFSLETPVKDIVGFPVVNPAFPEQDITVRQVLSHTSSLEQTQYYHPTWEEMRVNNKFFSAKAAPGTKYIYSNMNGGLIGAMIEALSGQSVNSYMQEHVFGPLGINAAYHPALLPDQSDISPRLEKNGKMCLSVSLALESINEYDDTCNPRENTNRTSGGLYISARALNRIIMMLQQGGELDGVRLLHPETVQLMMADQQTLPGTSVHCDSEYGLCMARVEGMDGGVWYGHQGMYEGLTSNIYFQPDTGLSVVVIANGYQAQRQDGVVTIARTVMKKAQEFLNK